MYLGGNEGWTADDREKNLAFMLDKSERCTMCGTAPWEWEEDRFAYEAMIETCQGCQMKDSMQEDAAGGGQSVVLVPRLQAAMMRLMPKLGARRRKT